MMIPPAASDMDDLPHQPFDAPIEDATGDEKASTSMLAETPPTYGQWRLMWCFAHCFKDAWKEHRWQFAEAAKDLGGKLICLKSPRRLEEFLQGRGVVHSVAMVDWQEAEAFLHYFATLPSHQQPKYVVLRCSKGYLPGSAYRRAAIAWLRENPLPTGMKHFVSAAFDANDRNLFSIMVKVAKLSAGHVEARVTGTPAPERTVGRTASAPDIPAPCKIAQDPDPATLHVERGQPRGGSSIGSRFQLSFGAKDLFQSESEEPEALPKPHFTSAGSGAPLASTSFNRHDSTARHGGFMHL